MEIVEGTGKEFIEETEEDTGMDRIWKKLQTGKELVRNYEVTASNELRN